MKESANTTPLLIIELAKLRNRVYELEDASVDKRMLENKIQTLERKIKDNDRNRNRLNLIVNDQLHNNIKRLIETINEFEMSNDKSLLEEAITEINKTSTEIKKIVES